MADNNYEIDVTLEETFGTGVRSVEQTATSAESGGMNEITVTLTNDQENKFYVMNGLAGKDGRDGGFPVAVGEASLMTDTSKIYLYVGIEEGYTQNHLYYWDGEAWHDYGTYGAPADYLRSASVTHEQGLDQLGNTTYTADTLTLEGNADGVPAETEFVQKLYYSAGENVDGALTQKATSEAIESAQYLPIVNHPNAPVGDTALSVELQQNVMNVIGGVGYAFTTITMTLATKKAGRVNRYFGRFTTGGNAFAVTWPTGVTVPSALSYKTQTTYDFVIEDSILHVWEDGNAVGDVLDATATANAVSTWLTNHPEATTTVADGSITTAKLASGVIDQTLTVQGAAADSAKVGQELSDLKSQISSKTGLSEEFKSALDSFMTAVLTLADNVAYDDDASGDDIYSDIESAKNAVHSAMYPPATLLSISAVYTQSGTVKDTDSLDSLKSDLVVTAYYDDSTSAEVNGYTLSGTLVEGTSTITVDYNGKTTTFNVTVNSSKIMLANWDLTDSLVDSVNGYEFTIEASTASYGTVVQNSNGVVFTNASGGMRGSLGCAELFPLGATVEFEIDTVANMTTNNGNKGATYRYGNGRLVKLNSVAVLNWQGQYDEFRAYYSSGWKDIFSISDPDYFNGKTVKLETDANGAITVKVDDVQIGKTANSLISSDGFTISFGYGTSQSQTFANMTIKSVKVYTEAES